MRINPNLFNDKGRIRLGSGYPTSLKWHPLFAEDEEYRYLAVSYSTGEIKLFRADQGDGSQTVNLILGHVFSNEETDACNHVDWSSDGQFLLGVYGRRIRKFDVYTNLEVFSFFGEGHGNYVAAAGFSPDGRYIASATKRALLIHEAGRGKAVNFSLELGKTDTITSVNYSPDGRHIAAGSRRGRVTLFEAATGNIVDAFKADRDPNKDVVYDSIRHVCFSPDGRCIASISTGNGITLCETASANRVVGFDGGGHRDFVGAIDFSPDGRYIVSGGGNDHKLILHDVSTGKTLTKFQGKGHKSHITSLGFSPDQRFIASGSYDGALILRKAKNGGIVFDSKAEGHRNPIVSVCLSPDGRNTVSGATDEMILREVSSEKAVYERKEKDAKESGHSICFSPDGRFLVSVGQDNVLIRRDAASGIVDHGFDGSGHWERIGSVDFSPDGRYIVSGADDNRLCLRQSNTGKKKRVFKTDGHDAPIVSVCFNPDGRTIASLDKDNQLIYRSLRTGKKIHGYYRDRRAKQFYSVDYSPDGHYVVLGGEGRKFILSEATSGKVVNAFYGDWDADTETQLFYTHFVRFSPNGHCFVTGSNDDDEIILRETATGKVFTRFSGDGHSHAITSIRFSPDGRYLVSGSADRMVIIWNLESILGPKLFAEYFSYPLVLTGVKFPKRTLAYLKKTNQGNIAPNRPLARCGECGNFFPVSGKMLGKQISCPVKTNDHNCGRLLRINTFTAG